MLFRYDLLLHYSILQCCVNLAETNVDKNSGSKILLQLFPGLLLCDRLHCTKYSDIAASEVTLHHDKLHCCSFPDFAQTHQVSLQFNKHVWLLSCSAAMVSSILQHTKWWYSRHCSKVTNTRIWRECSNLKAFCRLFVYIKLHVQSRFPWVRLLPFIIEGCNPAGPKWDLCLVSKEKQPSSRALSEGP